MLFFCHFYCAGIHCIIVDKSQYLLCLTGTNLNETKCQLYVCRSIVYRSSDSNVERLPIISEIVKIVQLTLIKGHLRIHLRKCDNYNSISVFNSVYFIRLCLTRSTCKWMKIKWSANKIDIFLGLIFTNIHVIVIQELSMFDFQNFKHGSAVRRSAAVQVLRF